MPADLTMPERTALHSAAAVHYRCHADERPPGAEWSIHYGYCRHSLDSLVGFTDPRCPGDCQHKAPRSVVVHFDKLFLWRGAAAAAKWARSRRKEGKR